MYAIQTLYEQHAPKVFRFAYGLCGDAHLANDLVAETFVRAMLSSTPIVTETVHAYLFTIARRLYLKEWHRRQRQSELEDEYCDLAPGPESQAIDAQSLRNTWGPDVIPAGSMRSSFSYAGKALPFVPNKDFVQELAGFQTGAAVRYRRPQDKGRAAFPAAAVAARIRVEDFKGPLLVAGGIEDQMWASGMMAQNIAERRSEAKLETIALIYTDAGHVLSGTGWNPTTQYDAGSFKTGGTPEANARAQAEVWRETVGFLKRTLDVQ